MKKLKKEWIVFFCLLSILSGNIKCYAKEDEETLNPAGLYAKSAVLMDGSSGRVLFEKNGEDFMANASTTKILTCILALEHAQLTDVVTVSSYAASMPDVQLHIKEGEQYYLKDLLYSLMLESHNDVAVAIAEHISGSQEEFSRLMNQKAKEIGCKNTCFLTPNGLDATQKVSENFQTKQDRTKQREGERGEDGVLKEILNEGQERGMEVSHGTTATDLARIMRYCIRISPQKEEFLRITRTPEYRFQNLDKTRSFSCRNHNAFLNMMEGALTGKTGFTGKAGYCYVGALEREGKCYVVALLACGWPNNKTYKWSDCRKLMDYGLKEYRLFSLQQLEEQYEKELTAIVKDAKRENLSQEAQIALKKEESGLTEVLLKEKEEVTVQIIKNVLEAPVREDQKAGTLTYYIQGEKWLEETLFCKEGAEKPDYLWCFRKVMEEVIIKISLKQT